MLVIRKYFFISFIAIVSCLIATLVGWQHFCTMPLITEKNEILYVPPGSTIHTVAKTLQARKLLRYPRLFILLAELEGKVHRLKAGEYELQIGYLAKATFIKTGLRKSDIAASYAGGRMDLRTSYYRS